MKLSYAIPLFLQAWKIEKNSSTSTISNYSRCLYNFLEFVGDKSLNALSSMEIKQWKYSLVSDGKNPKTVNLYMSALRMFLDWANIEGIECPTSKVINFQKIPKRVIKSLTKDQIDLLFKAIEANPKEICRVRDRAIIYTLLSTGLRVSELINLRYHNIRSSSTIIWKWDKERTIVFNPKCINFINQYFKLRWGCNAQEYVFLPTHISTSWPLSRVSIENICKEYWKKIWVRFTPHTLRHTFATLLLEAWAEIECVKDILGHSDINTTMIYVHNSIKKLKATHSLLDITPVL